MVLAKKENQDSWAPRDQREFQGSLDLQGHVESLVREDKEDPLGHKDQKGQKVNQASQVYLRAIWRT